MTKSQIKAELRRTACEEDHRPPWVAINEQAFLVACKYSWHDFIWTMKREDQKIFFLLVAEAI